MTKNRQFARQHAIELLVLAKETAQARGSLSQAAAKLYGEDSTWVSGGLQEHWPPMVKDAIRELAHKFGPLVDESLRLWTKVAGARRTTWLRQKEQFGVFHY